MAWRTFVDQLGNPVKVSFPTKRIISLVPSQTELLADLGLTDQIVGITKFCIHPKTWRESKAIIGGTKKFDFDKIKSLNPDLIIGNKEENYEEGIKQLQNEFPVWMSDIITMDNALNMIHQLGELTDSTHQADLVANQIKDTFLRIEKLPNLRSLYLIWRNPWMAAAPGTFIHELMSLAGLRNCLSDQIRYPELTNEDIASLNPELILLSSEPYPFQQKHIDELYQISPNAKIVLVDGEMFSWYGSRLKLFSNYLKSIRPSLI